MTEARAVNLLEGLPPKAVREIFETLAEAPGLKLERIVSEGQSTPKGEWLSSELEEWVLVLAGAAHLSFEGEKDFVSLHAGDSLRIPALSRHRVEWTDAKQKTVWLALHYRSAA